MSQTIKRPSVQQPTIALFVGVKVNMDELVHWPPENVKAFLHGLGKILTGTGEHPASQRQQIDLKP